MRKISPPPSMVKLVSGKDGLVDNEPDSIWKRYINLLYEEVKELLAGRHNHISIQNANFGKGTSAPTQVVIGNYTGWQYTIGDDSVFDIEMPHDVDADSDLGIHFTFVVNEAYATNLGEVNFQIDYSCVPHLAGGETLTAPGNSGTLTTGDINIPATAYEPYHVVNLTIPAADFDNGDLIGITLSRIAIIAGNNPTAHPVILTLHIEYSRIATDWYEPD